MLTRARGFDVTGLAEKARLFPAHLQQGWQRGHRHRAALRVRDQVQVIGDKLDQHRTKLLEDVERLERLYVATLDWFHALADHIEAGERVLKHRRRDHSRPGRSRHRGGRPTRPELRDDRASRDWHKAAACMTCG